MGNCYEIAFNKQRQPQWRDWLLVHGYPTLQAESQGVPAGTKYGHAWLELEFSDSVTFCWDPISELMIIAECYYREGQIELAECNSYTLLEAARMAVETGHYGDWAEPPADVAYAPEER